MNIIKPPCLDSALGESLLILPKIVYSISCVSLLYAIVVENSLRLQTVEEYERRERAIQRLTDEIEEIEGDLVGRQEKMAELKAK